MACDSYEPAERINGACEFLTHRDCRECSYTATQDEHASAARVEKLTRLFSFSVVALYTEAQAVYHTIIITMH